MDWKPPSQEQELCILWPWLHCTGDCVSCPVIILAIQRSRNKQEITEEEEMKTIWKTVKPFLAGLGVIVMIQIGADLTSLGSATDLTEWGRSAGLGLAGAAGAYVTTYFEAKSAAK